MMDSPAVFAQMVDVEVEVWVDVRNDGAAIQGYVTTGLQEGDISRDYLPVTYDNVPGRD